MCTAECSIGHWNYIFTYRSAVSFIVYSSHANRFIISARRIISKLLRGTVVPHIAGNKHHLISHFRGADFSLFASHSTRVLSSEQQRSDLDKTALLLLGAISMYSRQPYFSFLQITRDALWKFHRQDAVFTLLSGKYRTDVRDWIKSCQAWSLVGPEIRNSRDNTKPAGLCWSIRPVLKRISTAISRELCPLFITPKPTASKAQFAIKVLPQRHFI